MGARMIALLIAAFSGIMMAFQGALNSALSKVIGLLETTFVVQAVGLVFISLLLLIFNSGHLKFSLIGQAPVYTYLGGILGVVIVYGVIRSIPKVGVASATTAIILGQLFTAGLIDSFGLFGMDKLPFSWCRIAGVLLMAGGAWLLLHK